MINAWDRHTGMVRMFLLVLLMFTAVLSNAQQTYDSRKGGSVPAHGTYRILNFYINIVYDQTPERDPYYEKDTPNWQPGNPDLLNDHPPVYLLNLLDTGYAGKRPHGLMSRLFYEASLGHLILLGDFVVVNIRQSEITPVKKGADFGFQDVILAAYNKIDQLGGLKTVYGHDDLADYDLFEKGAYGLDKKAGPNGKIDMIMFCIRNSVRQEGPGKTLYNYGQNNPGEGNSYENNACGKCSLPLGGGYVKNEITTVQNVGVDDNSLWLKNIAFHEFAHCLFGGNGFHTSGGNHFGTADAAVFTGLQGGYGLMGGANSSLVCVNGYERWRMGWIDTTGNPQRYDIAVNNANGDLTKADGPGTFVLRDFITTGDALRIRLPYVDPGAEAQYLWLENHQVGKNGMLDFLHYSNIDPCRPAGAPGIYAYIQVGKDRLTGPKTQDVYPSNQADNLRMLTSKGNWDMNLDNLYDTTFCISWNAVHPAESYKKENAFCGYNDLQSHCFDTTGNAARINGRTVCTYPWIIRRHGIPETALPFMGDDQTAFSGHSIIDLSSNPAAVNVVTHYTQQYNMQFSTAKKTNNKTLYLSGLSIEMTPRANGEVMVDIRWDQYHIRHSTRWTGTIVMKEQLTLDRGATLWLDQNESPDQLERDTLSGFFSPVTTFTCERGSVFEAAKKSRIILDRNSRWIIRSGAKVVLGGKLILEAGTQVVVEEGAVFENKGKIIERGGTITGNR